jgi:GTPase SAR1 family protein
VSLVEPATFENCERFRPFYYKNSKAFIVCYSVDDRASFTNILYKWIPELKNVLKWPLPVILVGKNES